MYKTILKHKKGFTLAELMIVMALMGFGVVALANLFQSGIRTFNEQEERYIKQETVKQVAEYLQRSTNISTATKAEIYATSNVVPTVSGMDLSYAYIYVEPTDSDGDGDCDGYLLYKLDKGRAKTDAVCLNPGTPLYVTFNAYRDYDYAGASEIKNQCGIKVKIAAVDSDFDYGIMTDGPSEADYYETPENGREYRPANRPPDDYIYYSATVSYHFANMVTSSDNMRVNLTANQRDTANVYSEAGVVNFAKSVDTGGEVLRVTMDSSISPDSASVPISVSSFCFIATAGYGEATGEVGILCDFRDNVLMTNPLGRMFVKTYYAVSPSIADFIAESEPLKAGVRVMLKPLVAVAAYTLNPDIVYENIPAIIIFMTSVIGITAVSVKVHKRKKLAEEK